ncbi:unnamed protein product, partial [Laminaria digitata]
AAATPSGQGGPYAARDRHGKEELGRERGQERGQEKQQQQQQTSSCPAAPSTAALPLSSTGGLQPGFAPLEQQQQQQQQALLSSSSHSHPLQQPQLQSERYPVDVCWDMRRPAASNDASGRGPVR